MFLGSRACGVVGCLCGCVCVWAACLWGRYGLYVLVCKVGFRLSLDVFEGSDYLGGCGGSDCMSE